MITAEQIKKMHIPTGTPIEIILEKKDKTYRKIGYFINLEEICKDSPFNLTEEEKRNNPVIHYSQKNELDSNLYPIFENYNSWCPLNKIQEIRRLYYQK
jgi:hypothetical protein